MNRLQRAVHDYLTMRRGLGFKMDRHEVVEFRYQDTNPDPAVNYYYVRVRQEDGNMAWTSPIWVVQ
jgi:hypothetical protein